MRISSQEIQKTLLEILLNYNFRKDKAVLLANIFTESSLDGVYSHGLNRFPRFIQNVKDGIVKIDAEARMISSFGNIERWDGNLGPGILNARACLKRAMEIADAGGIGCVSLANTNHWMRGGTYGWMAAEQGFISICWTNTQPNMVAWGGKEVNSGNNPFVIAVPRSDGHIVLDMALSQFSFGKMEMYKQKGQKLSFPGGWDDYGKLTTDPGAILSNGKSLPIGYWKGSALSLILDVVAAILSLGDSTFRIGKRNEEYGLSQVFIAISIKWLDTETIQNIIEDIIQYVHSAEPIIDGESTFYPGERTLRIREENLKSGIPVNKEVWATINKL
jgi:3-dehydro-L-gulonate 2-dehydrogenase